MWIRPYSKTFCTKKLDWTHGARSYRRRNFTQRLEKNPHLQWNCCNEEFKNGVFKLWAIDFRWSVQMIRYELDAKHSITNSDSNSTWLVLETFIRISIRGEIMLTAMAMAVAMVIRTQLIYSKILVAVCESGRKIFAPHRNNGGNYD